jgi:hypothetical protein
MSDTDKYLYKYVDLYWKLRTFQRSKESVRHCHVGKMKKSY